MIIMLRLGRWRCRHAVCERWIFTKRLFQGLHSRPKASESARITPVIAKKVSVVISMN
jgi:hypothetical protein